MYVFFQAEDGIRDLVRSRGLGDVYKRQVADRMDIKRKRRIVFFIGDYGLDVQKYETWAGKLLSLIHI